MSHQACSEQLQQLPQQAPRAVECCSYQHLGRQLLEQLLVPQVQHQGVLGTTLVGVGLRPCEEVGLHTDDSSHGPQGAGWGLPGTELHTGRHGAVGNEVAWGRLAVGPRGSHGMDSHQAVAPCADDSWGLDNGCASAAKGLLLYPA